MYRRPPIAAIGTEVDVNLKAVCQAVVAASHAARVKTRIQEASYCTVERDQQLYRKSIDIIAIAGMTVTSGEPFCIFVADYV